MLINTKSFELGEKSGKKEALEDVKKIIDEKILIHTHTGFYQDDDLCKELEEIKKRLEDLK